MTTDLVGMLFSIAAGIVFVGLAIASYRELRERRRKHRKMLRVRQILTEPGFGYRNHIEGLFVVVLIEERLWDAAYAVLTWEAYGDDVVLPAGVPFDPLERRSPGSRDAGHD